MSEIKEKDINDIIKSGLSNFYILAKAQVSSHWANMSNKQRISAARALVYMKDLSKKPSLYFSKRNQHEKSVRIKQVLENNGIESKYALYIIDEPKDIILKRVLDVMSGEIIDQYYNFCAEIQNWENNYEKKDMVSIRTLTYSAEKLITMAEQSKKMVDLYKTNFLLRPLKKIYYQLQH